MCLMELGCLLGIIGVVMYIILHILDGPNMMWGGGLGGWLIGIILGTGTACLLGSIVIIWLEVFRVM